MRSARARPVDIFYGLQTTQDSVGGWGEAQREQAFGEVAQFAGEAVDAPIVSVARRHWIDHSAPSLDVLCVERAGGASLDLRRMFKAMKGLRVTPVWADDFEGALEKTRTRVFDCIVSNVDLGRHRAGDFMATIRDRGYRGPFILLGERPLGGLEFGVLSARSLNAAELQRAILDSVQSAAADHQPFPEILDGCLCGAPRGETHRQDLVDATERILAVADMSAADLRSVVFVELGGFSAARKARGGGYEEAALEVVTRRIERIIPRSLGHVGRWGTEAFAIVLRRGGATPARVAEKVVSVLSDPISVGNFRVSVCPRVQIAAAGPENTDRHIESLPVDLATAV